MASRRRRADDAAPADVIRRAPFAKNPRVGARGQWSQQRILDAALGAFGAEGYEQCRIDSITKRAGCSRAAFYQYFASKEDVFRHLSGQVARQLGASTEALGPLTPGAAGWRSLRAWVTRHSEIYARYEPIFHAFPAASESDAAVATGSLRWSERVVSRISGRIAATTLRPRALDAVILQLLECVSRTHDVTRILRSAAATHWGEDRVGDALTDVIHRSLFGRAARVNARPPPAKRPPSLRFDLAMRDEFARDEPAPDDPPTRRALLIAGRTEFAARGYHRTRVRDVTEAAGVSHGAFYSYFENKDQLARALTMLAMQTVSQVLAEIPAVAVIRGASGGTALRLWLRRYARAQAQEASMLRVWVDAALQDPALRASSAPAIDWGRRAMASVLEGRDFGDADAEGLVMVALLASFGSRERTPAEIDAAAHVVEQGLLGIRAR